MYLFFLVCVFLRGEHPAGYLFEAGAEGEYDVRVEQQAFWVSGGCGDVGAGGGGGCGCGHDDRTGRRRKRRHNDE